MPQKAVTTRPCLDATRPLPYRDRRPFANTGPTYAGQQVMKYSEPNLPTFRRILGPSAAVLLAFVGCSLMAPSDDELYGGDGDERAEGGSASEERTGGAPGAAGRMTSAGRAGSSNAGASSATRAGTAGVAGRVSVAGSAGRSASAGAAGQTRECTPSAADSESRACGACNKGTQSRTRTCSATGTWGAWSAWGTCAIDVDCESGASESRTVDCETCGTKRQTRQCSSSCTWGGWSDASTCSTDCDHCADVLWCTDPTTGGTTCRQLACTQAQALRDCQLDIPVVCGATKQPFKIVYL